MKLLAVILGLLAITNGQLTPLHGACYQSTHPPTQDLLIETCYGDAEARRHLPLSFNLESSLHDFIREHRRRAAAGGAGEDDNTWIVKPWNQGRSMGVVVSDSLPHMLRLMETGPKVVTKYIARPVTLRGFKFDLRVYLLVRQGGPEPRAYVHKV